VLPVKTRAHGVGKRTEDCHSHVRRRRVCSGRCIGTRRSGRRAGGGTVTGSIRARAVLICVCARVRACVYVCVCNSVEGGLPTASCFDTCPIPRLGALLLRKEKLLVFPVAAPEAAQPTWRSDPARILDHGEHGDPGLHEIGPLTRHVLRGTESRQDVPQVARDAPIELRREHGVARVDAEWTAGTAERRRPPEYGLGERAQPTAGDGDRDARRRRR
jgi:hypothetical protein